MTLWQLALQAVKNLPPPPPPCHSGADAMRRLAAENEAMIERWLRRWPEHALSIADLVQITGFSRESVRKYLVALDGKGKARRVSRVGWMAT